jgi:hypothetical protein
MSWANCLSYAGENRNAYWILLGVPKSFNNFAELGVDGRIILKWFVEE